MNIVYVHGYGSDKKSSTFEKMKEEFSEDRLFELKYNSETEQFNENFTSLSKQILSLEENELENSPYILVGSSLGGFYSAILSNMFLIPAFLINPAIEPIKTLTKLNVKEDIINSYNLEINLNNSVPKVILIGEKDSIVSPKKNIDFWKNKAEIIIQKDGEHQIKSLIAYRKKMEELLNTIAG